MKRRAQKKSVVRERLDLSGWNGRGLPPGQCDCWPGSGWPRPRCPNRGQVYLIAPDGQRVPGGAICRTCAERITAEYRAKLGEHWTLEPAE